MCINPTVNLSITDDGNLLEMVEEFTAPGSQVGPDNAVGKDINTHLGKARSTFARLWPIWKSKQYSLRTKIRLYNSNVKSILLYGFECCRVVQNNMRKLNVFQNSCLRKICGIYWPERNVELYRRTKCHSVVVEIKCRQLLSVLLAVSIHALSQPLRCVQLINLWQLSQASFMLALSHWAVPIVEPC